MSGSQSVTVTKLEQPDIPFTIYHIPVNHARVIKIYYGPFDLEATIISKKQSDKEINHFDLAMNGGNIK